jgi:hypothetical protein
VLALADWLRPHAEPLQTKAERETWRTVDELKACFERDRGRIEAEHDIVAALPEAVQKVRAAIEQMGAETRSRLGSSIFGTPYSR